MKFKTFLMAAAAIATMATAAQAVPVTGQISLGGYAQAVGSTGMGSATGLSFANASGTTVSGTSGALTSYGAGTGSFSALGSCASLVGCGTIKDISNFATAGTISSFLTLSTNTGATVSFDLTSLGARTYTQDSTGGSITFTASGLINYTGYDSTIGTFTLTSQGNQITSFSATTLASATLVPEPMSLALLGGALATVGLIRRKKA